MRRLMAGRSIGVLRQQMAEKGLAIGTQTIHRATLGEGGNRLESLAKIAEFFDTTVDQLLQYEGVDEAYWPFSEELQKKVLSLSDEELRRAENILRAQLDIPQQTLPAVTQTSQKAYGEGPADPYAGGREVDVGLPRTIEVPAPNKHGSSSKDQRPSHQKSGRGS